MNGLGMGNSALSPRFSGSRRGSYKDSLMPFRKGSHSSLELRDAGQTKRDSGLHRRSFNEADRNGVQRLSIVNVQSPELQSLRPGERAAKRNSCPTQESRKIEDSPNGKEPAVPAIRLRPAGYEAGQSYELAGAATEDASGSDAARPTANGEH